MIMNISRSPAIQHVYYVPYAIIALLAVGLIPFCNCVLAYQTQQCNRTRFRQTTSRKSRQYSFRCWALQSKKLTRLMSELLGGKFRCFTNSDTQEKQVTCERWKTEMSLSFHCICAKNI